MRSLFYIVLFVGLLMGCGDDEKKASSIAAIIDMGKDEGQVDSEKDIVEDLPKEDHCPRDGELLCGSKCVNVKISMDHCGECNNACIVGRMTCDGTACVCLKGKNLCEGDCWDLQLTKKHCGTCDNICTDSEACIEGKCEEISARPETVGILKETNIGRAQVQDCGEHGIKNPVGEVQLNALLMLAAQGHSEDMAEKNFMEHEGSDGSSPFQRATRKNYQGSLIGENIARGYRTPKATVAGWIDSDGHCQNLMNGRFTEMGVGFAISPMTGEFFWTQLFGRP